MRLELKDPVIITPRLLAGVKVGDAFVSIEYDRGTSDGRMQYRYCIDADGKEFESNDLRSGVGGGGLQSGLESLLCFLGAAGEGYRYRIHTNGSSENEDLFPEWVNEWAYRNSDELAMLECELQESEGLIVEN